MNMIGQIDDLSKGNKTELQSDEGALEYHITIKDIEQLKLNYMPYIKNGALFIPTEKQYRLNDLLAISIKLFDDVEEYKISGKVVWITPKFSQDSRPQGIGIQFLNKEARVLRDKIENLLAGSNDKNDSSTM